MNPIQRTIEVCILLLVIVCSLLLSVSIGSYRLFFISMVCAIGGFLVTDTYRLFHIKGWLANASSIAILVLAMHGFFDTDSSGKLIAVANLLVYLQSVLMFQRKTPRLNWQILVLSLLEVVISTIFAVGFSSSYLLLVYFVIAAITMFVQSLLTDSTDLRRRKRKSSRRLRQHCALVIPPETARSKVPVLIYDPPPLSYGRLFSIATQLIPWLMSGIAITVVLFLMAPRTSQPLFQAVNYKVAATGFNNRVDLNEKGKIPQAENVLFRSVFLDPVSRESVQLTDAPYFRSMALANLEIVDGQTTWTAPFDRIDDNYYQTVPVLRQEFSSRPMIVVTTLEQNTSPQIYAPMPVLLTGDTPSSIQFCHEISALTRCRIDGQVAAAPFKYQMGTLVSRRTKGLDSWPYIPAMGIESPSMTDEPMREQWLTAMDKSRYPGLVRQAQIIADEVQTSGGSRRDLVKRMTAWFSSNGYKYTLDYTNVQRDETIDVVEDFFSNHRSGHCEVYASALTLMLRSQGIPARLVVGFLALDHNKLTGNYVVKGKHAHAWCEVYLRKQDCTDAMFSSGAAGAGGAWLRADPNPVETLASPSDNATDSIELARTVWQDIVLGMDGSEKRHLVDDNGSVLYQMFLSSRQSAQDIATRVRKLPENGGFQLMLAAGMILFLLIRLVRNFRESSRGPASSKRNVGLLRRIVASAAGLLSHDLESWVLSSGVNQATGFYREMERILASREWVRSPTMSHLQFAAWVESQLEEHPNQDAVGGIVKFITREFNEVRFGNRTLRDVDRAGIDSKLKMLKAALSR